ncbi:hypothetical protein E3Q22_03659 [Wallemia mellicola]|uniref:Thioredoxin domain-containing protein n=1 Tax=Wallemia mellicola TaxID=1708541 RepID=A0A4T0MY58_9BASI|nr:hypothetical protein E3Q24_03484 [Wallemia mellicola]TIB76185.1 hypothetical protein E3Q22_03659 [Wallemia mellicola]TIB80797.1 hypothetical protein E3Q21_03585 [Wallemia mellicola]TIB84849.1 hypothetical protein E3Q20_03499 [Wallemia mellicola]TIB87876.1 hypothetical protein E3Q19_03497 [Wallemia mellicola]
MNRIFRREFTTSIKRLEIYKNTGDFNNLITRSSNKPLLVDWTAEWCPPCKLLAPLLENVSQGNDSKVDLIKIDVDENVELAREYSITSMPTVIAFKSGKPVSKFVGAVNKQQLDSFVEHINKI